MSNEEQDKNRLISMGEAAELYGFSRYYLSQIAKKGRLHAQWVGGRWLTTPADVEAYILSRERKGVFREDIQILD